MYTVFDIWVEMGFMGVVFNEVGFKGWGSRGGVYKLVSQENSGRLRRHTKDNRMMK